MNKIFRKSMVAGAVAVALALPALEASAAIAFRNNGVGPLIPVSQFNADAGNILMQNIAGDVNGTAQDNFVLYGQTRLANFGPGITAAPGFEYTMVMGIPLVEAFDGSTFSATLQASGAAPNFFEMWYGVANSDNQAGTGFRDGIRILSGTITEVPNFGISNQTGGNPTVFPIQLLDNRPGGAGTNSFNVGGATEDPTRTIIGGSVNPILTINTSGQFSVNVQVDDSNGAFFNGAPNFLTAAFTVNDSSPINTPFMAVAPAETFSDLGAAPIDLGTATRGGAFAANSLGNSPGGSGSTSLTTQLTNDGVGPAAQSLLTVNSFRCTDGAASATAECDFIAQGQGAGTISGAFIPEPGSVALLGLGLAGLGLFSRKRRKAV